MGDHTKKQHYVPQFSLRYFSAEGKGTHIYVYDKLRGESRLQSIRDVAHSNYFYNYVTESKKPATLEKDLARLETDAAKIIAQVVADESLARLGDDDRHVLAFYTGAQLLRTLHHRAYLRQLKDALRDVLASESFDKDFWIDLDQMDENTITRHHMESMKLTTEFHAHRLAIWHWVLLRASPPCRFYTSDNPIVQWGTVDETASFSEDINETSEVYLPLTPRLTLLALKPHVESPALGSIDRPSSPLSGRDTQIEVGAEAACLLNGFQVVSSERYVFSADEGFSQVEEMLAHNLDWKAGPLGK